VFIFNPEHELALANNDENFMPKASVKKLAEDLALLPLWISGNSERNEELCVQTRTDLLHLVVKTSLPLKMTDEISVWGWNKYIRKKLILSGINKKFLPSDEYLENIRELSHRKTASEAMIFLRNKLKNSILPQPAKILKNVSDIKDFAQKYSEIVLKSPYSSSGKGIYFSNKYMSNSILGWCRRTIKQQGCVLGEKRFDVVKNFAMLFQIVDNQTNFVGYSLFETDGKTYRNNILTSDENIEDMICYCGFDPPPTNSQQIGTFSSDFSFGFSNQVGSTIEKDLLITVKQTLMNFFNKKIAQKYNGFLGVDMFVFQENGKIFLNPCVEINLRYTMGLVAHEFYKNFVSQNFKGVFAIDFYKNSAELLQNHKQKIIDNPLIINDNKIINGYLSLCPVLENTNYRVRVEIL